MPSLLLLNLVGAYLLALLIVRMSGPQPVPDWR